MLLIILNGSFLNASASELINRGDLSPAFLTLIAESVNVVATVDVVSADIDTGYESHSNQPCEKKEERYINLLRLAMLWILE